MNIEKFVQTSAEEIEDFSETGVLERKGPLTEAWFNEREMACKGDEDLERLFKQMVESCYKYTSIVCDFARAVKSEDFDLIDEMDARRGRVHDATIDAFNILSRNMGKKGLDNSWIANLNGRVAYGELATTKTILDAVKYQEEQVKQLEVRKE